MIMSDNSNHCIRVFSLSGVLLRKWGTQGFGPGQFWHPWGVAVRGNEVLVADHQNHRIQVFRLDGTFVRMFGVQGNDKGQFKFPLGITVTRTGQVLVADSTRLQVFE